MLVIKIRPTRQITDSYTYDGNGNMTCRYESGQGWVQTYNAENRLSVVEKVTGDCTSHGTTTDTWTFTYDGDGFRVKEVYSGTGDSYTKYFFAGGSYEMQDDGSTQTTLRYYAIAGIMVAMHDGTDLVYFANDHLSSTSIVMDASGGRLSQNRYLPFGEVRDITGVTNITQTDFGYTGQRNLGTIGLMDYDARFYSPTLMRFTQPDTIIPNPSNPQNYNRYSYVNNNPIMFIDPTGQKSICMDEQCFDTTNDSYKHISTSVAAPPIRDYGLFGKQTNQPKDTFCERNPNFRECGEDVKDDSPVLEECTNIMQDNCIPNPPPFDPDSCYYNYGLFGCPENRGRGLVDFYDWDRVPKDELVIDVLGLAADVTMFLPFQVPATAIEAAQVVKIVTDKYGWTKNAGEIYIYSKGGPEPDWGNLALDVFSIPWESGLPWSIAGIVYNLGKGFHMEKVP